MYPERAWICYCLRRQSWKRLTCCMNLWYDSVFLRDCALAWPCKFAYDHFDIASAIGRLIFLSLWIKVPRTSLDLLLSPQTTMETVNFLYEFLIRYRFSTGLCTFMALQISIWWLRLCKCCQKFDFLSRWIKVPRTSLDLLVSPQTPWETVEFLYEFSL